MLLATPLNSAILRALSGGPMQQSDLQRVTAFPAQSTLRVQLKRMVETGAAVKRRRNRFPGALDYELSESGGELLLVADALERWLARACVAPMELGGRAAKAAIKAFVEAWSTTMLRALATGPLSLTDLDGIIGSLSYPSLERRLAAMRLAGLAEPCAGRSRRTPHTITEWAREGIVPLMAAIRWELRHGATPPAERIDAEAAFLLGAPLLRLPGAASGACRLTATIGDDDRPASVMAVIERGRIVTCTTRVDDQVDAWATGSYSDWLGALLEPRGELLVLGGACELVATLIVGMRAAYTGFITEQAQERLDSAPSIRDDESN